MIELLDILDSKGEIIGKATRDECHNGSFLLHSVVHVFVFNDSGQLLLQKRSKNKEIQPGKWDTSVGGHISSDETLLQALERETEEELGIRNVSFEKLYSYIMVSEIEREFVTTFRCRWNGPVKIQEDEIDEARFFTPAEIDINSGTGFFTPNFEEEWKYYKGFLASC